VLITDSNRHVRDLLRRELTDEGYRICEAKTDEELRSKLLGPDRPDLLILDPEIPATGAAKVMDLLLEQTEPLPVVIHSFATEFAVHPLVMKRGVFVEKKGDHIMEFKAVVAELLAKAYPGRFTRQGRPGQA
jgi:DNA-binding response OmpR family regulator